MKRTDGSKESQEFVDYNINRRYGNYEFKDIIDLQRMTATKEEVEAMGSEFATATTLTAFHYHNDQHPQRISVDSCNAKKLVQHAQQTNEPIMIFKAQHTPDKYASELEKCSAKEFQNLPNMLYLIKNAPVIITGNINPSLSLYNGALGKFVGPIYLRKTHCITDFELFNSAEVSKITFKTTKQIMLKLPAGTSIVVPVGTLITEINDSILTQAILNTVDADSFVSAKLIIPRCPPFLPDYLVVEIEGYNNSGGPPFFPNVPHMKDYVCIPPITSGKESENDLHVYKKRIQFPIELAYVMTAYKGIGATHKRTICQLKGKFSVPGLFLVACTRVRHPKHLYIPDDQMPNYTDLRKQRYNQTVLDSENLERVVRAKSAQEMRKSRFYETLPHFPDIQHNIVNDIADLIRDQWVMKGHHAKKDTTFSQRLKPLLFSSICRLIPLCPQLLNICMMKFSLS